MSKNYDPEQPNIIETPLPYYAEDFLVFLETILGKSKNTIKEYRYDLIMFFTYMCKKKGYNAPEECDLSFLRDIKLTDLYSLLEDHPKAKNNEHFRERIRATIYEHKDQYISSANGEYSLRYKVA